MGQAYVFLCNGKFIKQYSASEALGDKNTQLEYAGTLYMLSQYASTFTLAFFEIIEKNCPDWKKCIDKVKDEDEYIDRVSLSIMAYIISIFMDCEKTLLCEEPDNKKIKKMIDYYEISENNKKILLEEAKFAHLESNKIMFGQYSKHNPQDKLTSAVLGPEDNSERFGMNLSAMFLSTQTYTVGITDLGLPTFKEMLDQIKNASNLAEYFMKDK